MKISIIIPVYNVEKWISSTLDSILLQSISNTEILLVDDGSTDKSGAICDEYAAKHKEIQVFHIENQGVSNARNFGLTRATGDYVHFVDSDDVLTEGMYETFCSIASEYTPDILVCGCKRIHTIEQTQTLAHAKENLFLNGTSEIGDYLAGVSSKDKRWLLDYIWNKWYKRSFLEQYHLNYHTELSLGEDFHFNCNAFQHAQSIFLSKEIFYVYFIRNSGLVTAFQPKPWISRQILTDAHLALYQSYGLLERNRHTILCEDGMLAFAELRSVNSPRCQLTKKEKKLFLQKMYHSKQMELVFYYLKHSPKKLHKIWYLLMKYGNLTGVHLTIVADKADRLKRTHNTKKATH